MAYSYTRNQRRASKSLEKPVGYSDRAPRITEPDQYPIEIKTVDLAGLDNGYIDVTVFIRQRHEHRQRVYLTNFERTGPSYAFAQLVAACTPSTLEFTAAMDLDPRCLLWLEGARCVAVLERKAGALVQVNSQSRYVLVKHAPAQPDHESLLTKESFASRKEALDWADDRGIPYAYMQVSRWKPWADAAEHNTSLYEIKVRRAES